MPLAESDVTELIGMIMSTTVDFDVQALEPGSVDARIQPVLEAEIRITGTWRGSVILHASEALASRFAQRMFDLGSTAPTPQETHDALGELVNMTGGNIKGLLSDAGAHLSLPSVSRAEGYQLRVREGGQMGRFEYACDGEPLVITVLEGLVEPCAN